MAGTWVLKPQAATVSRSHLAELLVRLNKLRRGAEDSYVFKSRNESPMNPGNWLRREIHPVALKLGIALGGWHDFRHFFTRELRRGGAHPKVVSSLLGHARVNLAMDTYGHADERDMRGALEMLHGASSGKKAA